MITIENAILKTLAYADVFDFPLTEHELWRYLIGKPAKFKQFRRAVAALIKRQQIWQRSGFYALKSSTQKIAQRKKLSHIAQAKFKHARRAAQILKIIPSVWLVGVSGALAMTNAPEDDDIDFFIITAPGTLWTTRFLSTLLLDILSWRRKPGDRNFKNKICLNLFLDGARLAYPVSQRDIYSAHELVQCQPLFSRNQTYEKFYQSNLWVRKYLPYALPKFRRADNKVKPRIINQLLSIGEGIFRKWQYAYMVNKITREVVNREMLKFHPQDAREWVIQTYLQKLKQLNIKS